MNKPMATDDCYTAEDYERDLFAILVAATDIHVGNQKFPEVSARFGIELALSARILTTLAKQHGRT